MKIETDQQHKAALIMITAYMDKIQELDKKLQQLAKEVEAYEKVRWPDRDSS